MSDNIYQKIFGYLTFYKDLYGSELIMDAEGFREQLQITGEKLEHPLWKYKKEIENCQKCALGGSRIQFVFGVGNPAAQIMFVGEAPGAEEDKTGIPFVGRAGKLLDKLLEEIKFKRDDVFIANILKCRPPNNRDPLPDEVEKCIPYLHRQIEIVQPSVIVALGRIAAQNLLGITEPLRNMRGRTWLYQGVDMIVTYHPAAVLRNPNLMENSREDFRTIARICAEKQIQ